MTKVFSKGLMASEDVQSMVGSLKFYAEDAYAAIHDGAFVVLGDLDLDNVYSTTSVDYNVYTAKAPEAETDEVVVVDIAGISEGIIAGNTYRIGNKLVDLEASAGYPVRFRRLAKHDKFWLGEGNFASTPTEGEYAILTAGDTVLTPSATEPADQFGVKIIATQDATVGQLVARNDSDEFEMSYLCEVVSLA